MPRSNPSQQVGAVLSNRWLSLFALAGILVGSIFLTLFKLAYTNNALCIAGIHVHHVLVGVVVMILGFAVFPVKKFRHWSMFLLGVGAVMFLGGLLDVALGQPLPLYC